MDGEEYYELIDEFMAAVKLRYTTTLIVYYFNKFNDLRTADLDVVQYAHCLQMAPSFDPVRGFSVQACGQAPHEVTQSTKR